MRIAVLFTAREEMSRVYNQDWQGRETNDDKNAVIHALKRLGHKVIEYSVDLDVFEKLRKDRHKIDMVFNLCDDGFFSNPMLEPHLPAMLEILSIPYTGCGYLSLALCVDKAGAKNTLLYNGIPTPRFQVYENSRTPLNKGIKFPLIVKPVHEDASIGIKDESVVHDKAALRKIIASVIKEYKQPALVEEYIDGREFNVGIICGDNKEVLPLSEIVFDTLPKHKPRIVSYAAKWDDKSIEYHATVRSCPAKASPSLAKELTRLALNASTIMLCNGYCRVDFRVSRNGDPYVLEVNPNPDISEDAGLVAMAKAKGYSYDALIAKVLAAACEVSNKRKSMPKQPVA